MNNDIDMKLYKEYLNGKEEAFETLYLKYKNKIQYFVFNIIKDYQKSEDIVQEVFIYIFKNKLNDKYSFKYQIYLIAKSRAISYVNVENRRKEIIEQYFIKKQDNIEDDILEILINEEDKKQLIEAINKLEDKYKNAIYLVKIEGFSYKETAEILGESVQNVKNLVYRGKNMLFKILIKKGVKQMNKVLKVFFILLGICVILSGVIYATIKIYDVVKEKAKITPIYTSKISTIDTNKVWIGTFNLIWNDFMNDIVGGKIEFEDGDSKLVDELNKQSFTENQLSSDSYFKIHGVENVELKNKIEQGIKEKFNETSDILNKCDFENENQQGYILYAMLKKEFNYLKPFSILEEDTFGNSKEKVKYFGIGENIGKSASENVEILFYNSKEDFAIKLKTKEGEEVYLYKAAGVDKTFEENYNEMLKKQMEYVGSRNFENNDILKIPFININDEINYDELCGRYIKGTKMYIAQAIQTIEFELNNYGGSVKSEALMEVIKQSLFEKGREFVFNDTFLLYLKEANKNKPYFALRVDDTDILVSSEH